MTEFRYRVVTMLYRDPADEDKESVAVGFYEQMLNEPVDPSEIVDWQAAHVTLVADDVDEAVYQFTTDVHVTRVRLTE